MPVHDWIRVDAGIFDEFHGNWIFTVKNVLNHGVLPLDFYAIIGEVEFSATLATEPYARKRNRVVIRHVSDHRVVAVVEIVSPGNKASRHAIGSFVAKSLELLDAGIHLLILDLLPPGPRDPQGIHGVICSEISNVPFELPADYAGRLRRRNCAEGVCRASCGGHGVAGHAVVPGIGDLRECAAGGLLSGRVCRGAALLA